MVNRPQLHVLRRLAATAVVAPIGAFCAFVLAAVLDAQTLSLVFIGGWVLALGVRSSRGATSGAARALLLAAAICTALLAIAAVAFAWYELACGSQGCFD